LSLKSLTHSFDALKQAKEAEIISMLLNAIGDMKPQLVGYNLANADLKILVQMANTSSVKTTKLAKRPYKH